MFKKNPASPTVAPSEDTPDVSRRNLVSIFGVLATGSAALALSGCLSEQEAAASALGSTEQALLAGSTSALENISELTTPAAGDSRWYAVLGYQTPGDGGGGTFFWDETSIEDDDGGRIIDTTGGGTGRWKRSHSGTVDVKWFGAHGNDDKDDTDALRAAVATGYDVFVSPGDYFVTGHIHLTQSQTLAGNGHASHIRMDSEASAGEVVGIRGTLDEPIVGACVRNLRLSAGDGTNDNGVGISYARGCLVTGIFFERIGRKAITLQYYCTYNKVTDCHIESAVTEDNGSSTHGAISIEGQDSEASQDPGDGTDTHSKYD